MINKNRTLFNKLFFIALLITCTISHAQEEFDPPVQISGPMVAFGDVNGFYNNSSFAPGLMLIEPQISADEKYVIYIADQLIDEKDELFSVPIGGGTPVKLNSTLPATGDVVSALISPDSTRVIYLADAGADNIYELFSVPITGGTPVLLNDSLITGGSVNQYSILISPDSQTVVYVADQNTLNRDELFSVPITGGSVIQLSPALPTFADVEINSLWNQNVIISPNSQRVVYLADQITSNSHEIYSVPITGGTSTRINGDLVSSGKISEGGHQISPDSQRVVYQADQTTDNVFEIYSAPILGGTAIKLNTTPVLNGDVYNPIISPDSQTVVYVGDQDTDQVFELFSVPIAGGTVTQLNGNMVSGGDVSYSYPPLITPDSQTVIYIADQLTDYVQDLYSVPITGGSFTQIDANVSTISPQLYNNGSQLVYAKRDANSTTQIYSASINGGSISQLTSFGNNQMLLSAYVVTDNQRVIFSGEHETDNVSEIFSVPVTGGAPTKLNDTLPFGSRTAGFRVSQNSNHIIYSADQDIFEDYELFSVAIPPAIDDEFCFPIIATNSNVAVICL